MRQISSFLKSQKGKHADVACTTADKHRYHGAPTHIAFTAPDRFSVRDCYTAALNAGARPSGSPSYRQDDCKCFNAAVEDFDGNTVEFIWRDNVPAGHHEPIVVGRARPDFTARPAPTRSQTAYAVDNASPRRMGIQRARTDPVDSAASRSILGVVLGATVAAVGYVILSSERYSARDDAQHSSYTRSRERSPRSRDYGPRRSASVASGGRSYRRASLASPRTSDYLPSGPVVRQIDAKPYRDDEDISHPRQSVTRYNQGQSRALGAIEYSPSTSSTRRSATMPMEDQNSNYSRRGSMQRSTSRRDSVISGTASRSRRAPEEQTRSSYSQASTVKPIKKHAAYYLTAAAGVALPPSVVSKAPPTASTLHSSRRSRFDAYYLDDPEESDGLGDTDTVVPDDSISCVGLTTSQKRSSSRKSSRTERRGSIMTIPLRSGHERSTRTRDAYSNA